MRPLTLSFVVVLQFLTTFKRAFLSTYGLPKFSSERIIGLVEDLSQRYFGVLARITTKTSHQCHNICYTRYCEQWEQLMNNNICT